MPQNVFKFKYLSRILVLIISLYSLDFISPLAAHAMEQNENKSEHKSKKIIIKFTTYTPNYKLPTSSSKEKNIKSKNENSNNNLCVLDKNDSERNEPTCLPQEILAKIFFDIDQFTLIRADTVCCSFKQQGDRIWETKLLDLSRKLETPSQKGLDRVKTLAALEGGRYKNVRLQYCGLGDLDESFSLRHCKILDVSHNYIANVSNVCSPEALKNLQELHLSHNMLKIKEKSLHNYLATNFPNLKRLDLSYNGLSQGTVTELRNISKKPEILILEPQIVTTHYGPSAYGGTTAFAAWEIIRK